MRVLIVESTPELAQLWSCHLARQGMEVLAAHDADAAVAAISHTDFDVIILDLILESGSALAVADYAQYRRPHSNVIFVTDTTFFSDGSIFSVTPNARAFVPSRTAPEDLAALVEHYGRAA